MHRHDHDHRETDDSTAPRSRVDPPHPLLLQAAAAGRADVLGPAGVLGVQRLAGNSAAADVVSGGRSPVLDVLSSSGETLDEPVRADMESRMGHDFGDVRVHTGDAADASARSVSAHAYTVGSNIVFQRGAYDPGSTAGRTMLAHELTHVVQQRTGPVDGTSTGDGVRVSHPSDRFEQAAAANAENVMSQPMSQQMSQPMSQPAAPPVQASPASAPVAGVVQREAAEEEEVQAAHDTSLPAVVQREEAEEEEPAS